MVNWAGRLACLLFFACTVRSVPEDAIIVSGDTTAEFARGLTDQFHPDWSTSGVHVDKQVFYDIALWFMTSYMEEGWRDHKDPIPDLAERFPALRGTPEVMKALNVLWLVVGAEIPAEVQTICGSFDRYCHTLVALYRHRIWDIEDADPYNLVDGWPKNEREDNLQYRKAQPFWPAFEAYLGGLERFGPASALHRFTVENRWIEI